MTKKLIVLAYSIFIGIGSFGQTNIKAKILKEHAYFLASDSLEGRGLGTKSGLIAAHYIADYFSENGVKPIGESYLHPFESRVGQTVIEGNNVVGIVRGSDPVLKNEYIVLGAHFDHIAYKMVDGEKVVYNGADDNASGTSAVMELGRALAKIDGGLKRSVILVTFDGEESGLIGSGKFIKQEIVPIDQIKVMMSIDMIGRYAESNSVIMGAMENIEGGKERLMPHAEKYDIKIKRTDGGTSMRTDTKPFGDAGVPAVYVTSGIIGPYHKPEDDRETLDYEGMEIITNMLFDLTVDLANGEEIVSRIKAIPQLAAGKKQLFRIGMKANIGGSSNIYPNDFFKAKAGFSGEAGLISQIRLSKNLFLQPEVLYSYMSTKHPAGKFRMHSVTTPLSLVVSSEVDPSINLRFYASFGGYFGYHFAGSQNKVALDFTNFYDPIEGGLVYGLGFEFNSISVSVNFKNSLTNMLLAEGYDMRNRAVYFTIGKMFN